MIFQIPVSLMSDGENFTLLFNFRVSNLFVRGDPGQTFDLSSIYLPIQVDRGHPNHSLLQRLISTNSSD